MRGIVFSRISITGNTPPLHLMYTDSAVSNTPSALDKVGLASATGLVSSLIPGPGSSISKFNSSTSLKLGPAPISEKLREQVIRTLQDEQRAQMNGDTQDEDVEMPEVKIEREELDPSLESPGEGETNPPAPTVFRIADVKREVEAVRDRRKMVRLGPKGEAHGTPVLPSVVAFTVFDGGEA